MRDCAGDRTGRRRIDLNADLGEGFGVWRLGDDDALLDLVTSANVACGFHAGDPSTMRRVCARAAAAGVAVGAQVSYRDLAGFGRRFIDVEPGRARPTTCSTSWPRSTGSPGPPAPGSPTSSRTARSTTRRSPTTARPRRSSTPSSPTTGGCRCSACRARRCCARPRRPGMRPVAEGFADRGYTPDGALVPRREPGALVRGPRGGGRAGRADGHRRRRRRGRRHAAAHAGRVGLRPRGHPGRGRRWRGRSGRRWTPPGSSSRRSPADFSGPAGRRSTARSRPASRSSATSSTVRPVP